VMHQHAAQIPRFKREVSTPNPVIAWIANPNIGAPLEAKMLQNARRC
jgi:hypothetical protein